MKNTAKLIIASSLMASFLGLGCNSSAVNVENAVASNGEELSNTKEKDENSIWEEVAEKWNSMDEVKVSEFDEVYDKVIEEKEDMSEILNQLIEKGNITPITGEAINYVYGENLKSSLESTVLLPCCYEPMPYSEWDCTGIDSREGLEKKLALLEELYEKETVEKEILDTAKIGLEQRLSLLDRADEYWSDKGEGKCKDHPGEVDILLHLYDQNIGDIQGGKDVSIDLLIASEHILELEGINDK